MESRRELDTFTPSSKLPVTSFNFKSWETGSHPSFATVPLAFPLICDTCSPSTKLTFLRFAVNLTKSLSLITLPNTLVVSNVPPVLPIPVIGYDIDSLPPVVFTALIVKNLYS